MLLSTGRYGNTNRGPGCVPNVQPNEFYRVFLWEVAARAWPGPTYTEVSPCPPLDTPSTRILTAHTRHT